MKRPSLYLVVVLYYFYALPIYAEDNNKKGWEGGFVVTSNHDTIYGGLNIQDPFSNCHFIEFKTGTSFLTYTPEDIILYSFNDRIYHVIVSPDNEVKVFMEQLASGVLTLYGYYVDTSGIIHYYLEKENESPLKRINHAGYEYEMLKAVEDYSSLAQKVLSGEFSYEEIQEIVNLYNDWHLNDERSEYPEKLKTKKDRSRKAYNLYGESLDVTIGVPIATGSDARYLFRAGFLLGSGVNINLYKGLVILKPEFSFSSLIDEYGFGNKQYLTRFLLGTEIKYNMVKEKRFNRINFYSLFGLYYAYSNHHLRQEYYNTIIDQGGSERTTLMQGHSASFSTGLGFSHKTFYLQVTYNYNRPKMTVVDGLVYQVFGQREIRSGTRMNLDMVTITFGFHIRFRFPR